jgi:hypothetical protein
MSQSCEFSGPRPVYRGRVDIQSKSRHAAPGTLDHGSSAPNKWIQDLRTINGVLSEKDIDQAWRKLAPPRQETRSGSAIEVQFAGWERGTVNPDPVKVPVQLGGRSTDHFPHANALEVASVQNVGLWLLHNSEDSTQMAN